MASRRTAKAAQAFKEVVSRTILFELHDPRVKGITVLDVEVAPDMRSAKVYVSIMGEINKQHLALQGLNSARGFLQKRIADQIDTRYTPILSFELDDSVKKSIQAAQILRQIAEEREQNHSERLNSEIADQTDAMDAERDDDQLAESE